jgi:hypothetical protein
MGYRYISFTEHAAPRLHRHRRVRTVVRRCSRVLLPRRQHRQQPHPLQHYLPGEPVLPKQRLMPIERVVFLARPVSGSG